MPRLRRARWLLLTLWLILAYNTAGEAYADIPWAPTYEGLSEASLHAVRLIVMLGCLSWLFVRLGRDGLLAGLWGVLQSFADGLKVFLQETIVPSAANKGLFLIAPIVTFTVALMAWAVIPFNSGAVLADINVGLLYILAISSLGVYGVVVSGWASNSK